MNRLRAYRAIEGLNQDELGRILKISPQMVSAIESGRRTLSGNLDAIGYSMERLPLPTMSPPLHRHRASTTVTATNRAHELLRLAGEVFGELRNQTDRAPHLTLERFSVPVTTSELEEIAIEVRCVLQHEAIGPIHNLTAAVEQAGVCLIPITGLSGIDGLSSWVDGVPVIGVSPSISGDRFRFTLGHELGHLLFHIRKTDNSEGEANRFAGALLIPQAEFDAAMPQRPQLRDFIGLKSSWGISVAALVYRAHELEYIDDKRYRALQIQMSKWHKSEPGTFDPAHGQLLPRLIEVNGGVEAAASQLGVNSQHLRELTNWSHLRRVTFSTPQPAVRSRSVMTNANKTGKVWSSQDQAEFRHLAKGNTPTRVISLRLGRTENTVPSKTQDLKVSLKPTNQSPYNRRSE